MNEKKKNEPDGGKFNLDTMYEKKMSLMEGNFLE